MLFHTNKEEVSKTALLFHIDEGIIAQQELNSHQR